MKKKQKKKQKGTAVGEHRDSAEASLDAIEGELSDIEEAELPDESEQEEVAAAPRVKPKPVSAKGVVPYDPLQAYLREVKQYPRLTKEEELELAKRYQQNKDVDAAYQLVSSNLWLVIKIAKDYERAARSLLDLIQEGNIGLMEAVKNFDPHRGTRFPSYASWWIKAYVIRFVIANWRLVKIGTTQAQRKLFFNLNKEKRKLEQAGFKPGPKLLAERLNVKEREIIEMEQRLGSPDVSVDAPLSTDSDSDMLSVIPADQATAEDALADQQLKSLFTEALAEFTAELTDQESLVFKGRLLSDNKATLKELSTKLSVSQEWVRQIQQKLEKRLADFMKRKLGTIVQDHYEN